jgi:hypothetical protein
MSTGVMRSTRARAEDYFFAGMDVVILVSVFLGFARTYYLAGIFRAPLPNLLVHVHGAVFTCRIVLLTVQTSLVAAGRVDIHRRLGMFGFGLACLMVILGLLVATDSLGRHAAFGAAGAKGRAFYAIPLTGILTFATLIYFAFRNRFNPAVHKRLILIATITILDAAFDRWPIPVEWWGPHATSLLCVLPPLLVIMAYDYWSTGKVLRVTILASLFVVAVQQLRFVIGGSAPFQTFAAWIQTHAPTFH